MSARGELLELLGEWQARSNHHSYVADKTQSFNDGYNEGTATAIYNCGTEIKRWMDGAYLFSVGARVRITPTWAATDRGTITESPDGMPERRGIRWVSVSEGPSQCWPVEALEIELEQRERRE